MKASVVLYKRIIIYLNIFIIFSAVGLLDVWLCVVWRARGPGCAALHLFHHEPLPDQPGQVRHHMHVTWLNTERVLLKINYGEKWTVQTVVQTYYRDDIHLYISYIIILPHSHNPALCLTRLILSSVTPRSVLYEVCKRAYRETWHRIESEG